MCSVTVGRWTTVHSVLSPLPSWTQHVWRDVFKFQHEHGPPGCFSLSTVQGSKCTLTDSIQQKLPQLFWEKDLFHKYQFYSHVIEIVERMIAFHKLPADLSKPLQSNSIVHRSPCIREHACILLFWYISK